MCLLDARCHCENQFCNHVDNPLMFNSLFPAVPFLNQPVLKEQEKNISKDLSDLNGFSLTKKVKKNQDISLALESMQIENKQIENFPFQNTFIPLLNSIQQINPTGFQAASTQLPQNNTVNNNNGNFGSSFLLKQPIQQQNQNVIPSSSTNNISINLESIMKDMSARIVGVFAFQSKLLTDLQEKSNLQTSTISQLFQEVRQIKNIISESKPEPSSETQVTPIYSQIVSQNDNCSIGGPISPQGLIQFLFKKKECDYKYKLILNTPLDQPLYRERNFNINVSLVDRDDNTVCNMNRIPLNISIYTSENPPKFIETNTSGNKILKGFTEKDLSKGTVSFDKIQVKEVTSHFRNGWVFLVIFPKQLNYESGKLIHRKEDIDMSEIRPLVIEKVVVKAKKLKEGKKGNSSKEHSDDSREQYYEKVEEI